jgi:hypothetical protein
MASEYGEDVLREKVEVPGLAKEMSLVGGDVINHHGALVQLIRLRHQLVVLLHAGQAEEA